jgi:hypothetical protein
MINFEDACACMGPILGQPHCPCKMQKLGLSDGTEYKWSQDDKDRLENAVSKLSKLSKIDSIKK